MKKAMKKLMAALLAVAMVCAMVAPAFADDGSTTAAAATGTGSITINNAVPNQTYTIYRILALEYHEGTRSYLYKVTPEWKSFVQAHPSDLKLDDSTGVPVQMFSVQAPQGTNSRISLPDGSQVWLNAGSTLNYRSDFNRSSRDIGLSGEAYFEVARNADLPFRVQARGCTFTVLGTRFNISAYDEDPDVLAALMEGSLQFESSRSTETMVPGDLITYDCRTMEASRRQVDTDQFRSWIDGIIRYDAISLPALLRRLAREYDVKIELCTDAFDDKTFRISITEAQDIESIMGGLCDILPISVRRDTCGYRVDSRPRKTEP